MIVLRDKKCAKQAFCTVAMYRIAKFFTGNETDLVGIALFVEEDETGRMPGLVCFAIYCVKRLGAPNAVE